MSTTTVYSISYHPTASSSSSSSSSFVLVPGFTTDRVIFDKIVELQEQHPRGMPQFKTSTDPNDHGEYNETVKKRMETKLGGIVKTSRGWLIDKNCRYT
jgi:hypothetical protein